MSDEEAEKMFASIRWAETDGKPVCPHCGGLEPYQDRRPSGIPRFRCKACKGSFSLTSGTLFASRQMPLRNYLAAIVIFINEVKGKSALALSRDLGVQYKSAWVLSHKLREALASEMKGKTVGGEGRICEVDGGHFGGYIKPANLAEHRVDRRLSRNQNGKRKVVVVIRERSGRTLTQAFATEAASTAFIKSRVAKGTEIMADEAGSWNSLHASFPMKRINHEQAYSLDGACTNGAEEFFSRLRRAEIGHFHHIAGVYIGRYAAEAGWRDDHRRESNGAQFRSIVGLVAKNKPSVDFCGYWQRTKAA
jgi:transposase-like protein